MSGAPFDLELEIGDPGLIDHLVASGAERIGLDGLMSQRSLHGFPAIVRGAAARRGFRWNVRDTYDTTWWPQGIDVAEHGGRRVLAVSWYARPVRGVQQGVRLSFVDLRSPLCPRYHHVLLVEPVQDAAGTVGLAPIVIHAGGIAWLDDRILVADTFGGLREFALHDLMRVSPGPFGYATVLPQSGRRRLRVASGDRGMRFSFVSLEHGDGGPLVVAGEYGRGSRADRLARLGLDGTSIGELHEPGLRRMQGVCIVDGTWYVTTSNGEHTLSDLWVGTPGAMTRHRHVLPPGSEDLAHDQSTGRLWSLSEWPGARRVFTIDPVRWQGKD